MLARQKRIRSLLSFPVKKMKLIPEFKKKLGLALFLLRKHILTPKACKPPAVNEINQMLHIL